MGVEPILCICVSINKMLNFDLHAQANVMCKQRLKLWW